LVILAQADQGHERCDVLEAVDPFLLLTPLTTNVKQLVGQLSDLETRLCNPSRLDTTPEDILISWNLPVFVLTRTYSLLQLFSLPQWPLENKTKYTFIALPSIRSDPFMRPKFVFLPKTGQPIQQWDNHYLYHTVPDLECHIAPPFLAINGGPKCAGTDLDAITLDYCNSSDSRVALKRRLELLCEIWKLFLDAKEDAINWQRDKRGKSERMRKLRGLLSPANALQGHNHVCCRIQPATG
jgi:hypothetical protein